MMQEARARFSRRVRVFLSVGLIALVLPVSALAWFQNYVQNQTIQPLGFKYSSFNSNLNTNYVEWNAPQAIFGLTLCNSGGSCYSYVFQSGGTALDNRTISYGRAKCYWPYSNQTVFVFRCTTDNV